jgi:hypothetical protein
MHTMTCVSTGAPSTGRITTRSRSTPPANEIASVAAKAAQYGMPAFSRDHAR